MKSGFGYGSGAGYRPAVVAWDDGLTGEHMFSTFGPTSLHRLPTTDPP